MNHSNHPILSLNCDFAAKKQEDHRRRVWGLPANPVRTHSSFEEPIRTTDDWPQTTDKRFLKELTVSLVSIHRDENTRGRSWIYRAFYAYRKAHFIGRGGPNNNSKTQCKYRPTLRDLNHRAVIGGGQRDRADLLDCAQLRKPKIENERKTMNDKFDELAKNMAQSVTRRGALRKFGVGLAGIALATLGLVNRAQAGRACATSADCPADKVCLSGVCQPPSKGNCNNCSGAPYYGCAPDDARCIQHCTLKCCVICN